MEERCQHSYGNARLDSQLLEEIRESVNVAHV
jgi:hypothetical protein